MASTGTGQEVAERLLPSTSKADSEEVDFGPLKDVFRFQPPTLEEFVEGADYLGNPSLSPIQYDAVRHLEQVFYPETYAQMAEVFGSYWDPVCYINFAYLEWGKGSGKDHVCRIAVARVVHLLMCLKSPQAYYDMPPQDTIHVLNVAASSTQAHRAFFVPLKKMISHAPCFKIAGKDFFEEKEFSVAFHNQVECVSGHSMMETLEGLNILVGLADEISAFKTKDEIEATSRQLGGREPAKSAESIMRVLRTSARTRFPRSFKVAAISYPRFKGDAIQQLRQTAELDIETRGEGESRMYASGPHATWDVNPRVPDKEAFREDYDEDPEMARAMYECKPEISMRRFMRNTEAIYAAMAEKPLVPPVYIDYRWGRTDREEIDPDTMIAPADHDSWQAEFLFSPDLVPIQGAAYALHADMAISGDSAGIAMAHVRRWREGEWDSPMGEVLEMRPLVKVDFVTSLDAELKALPQPRDIQIRWFRKLVWQLTAKGFYVASVTMDNFQCLSGETEVALLDGASVPVVDLVGREPFWLYSIQEGRVVPALCSGARKTGERPTLEVVLDNGEVIRCTGTHPFMVPDGSYVAAADLVAGDSLMPLYRRTKKLSPTSQEYEQVWQPTSMKSSRRWQFTHSVVTTFFHGPKPKGYVDHHQNFDPRDNRPDNLRRLSNAAHSTLHSRLANGSVFKALWKDPVWAKRQKQVISDSTTASNYRRTGLKRNKGLSLPDVDRVYEEAMQSDTRRGARALAPKLGVSWPVVHRIVRDAGYSSWKEYRQEKEEAPRLYNHKVVEVRQGPVVEVFDLEVPETSNFALSSGVFVHNSADTLQILLSRGIEADKLSTDRNNLAYNNLKDVMYDGRLEGYWDEITVNELMGLTLLPNGKIDHPPGGSKDRADALAGAVLGAVMVGGDETEDPVRADEAGIDWFGVGSGGYEGASGDGLRPFGDWDDMLAFDREDIKHYE